jgi:hypothetical protein
MNTQLTLFTDRTILSRTNRSILTRFLEDYQAYLPPDAAALLATSLNSLTFEEYCAAWAKQFASVNEFGAPLQEALHAIEFLAMPDNASILDGALSQLPPGYEINRNFSSLHQAIHLWMLAHSPAGVSWPIRGGNVSSPSDTPTANDRDSASAARDETSNPPSAISEPHAPRSDAPHAPDAPPSVASAKEGPISQTDAPNAQPAPGSSFSVLPSPFSCPDSSPEAEAEANAEADAAADAVILRRLKPWPEPITDAPALFDQVHDRAVHYLYLPPGAAVVLTLWPGHTHAVKAFTHSPRLYVTSTEPGCGKTTALDFIACLCPNVLRTDNIKPAVVYRVTNKHDLTLVLDEFDAYAHQYPDLRGIIDAGHNQHGCVLRCAGPNVRSFKAYAATAIAGIGDLAPTLAHRSIIIRLTKAPPGALRARFDRRHTKFETTLGRKIARWVQDNYAAIAACDPVMPPDVINRLADNWRPLFAIAQVIGGHWPQRLLEAFNQLTAAPQAENSSVSKNGAAVSTTTTTLLIHIRQVFNESGATRILSSALVAALSALNSSLWPKTGPSAFTESRLARYLGPLGVRPHNLRINGSRGKGYTLADFAEAFSHLVDPNTAWFPEI